MGNVEIMQLFAYILIAPQQCFARAFKQISVLNWENTNWIKTVSAVSWQRDISLGIRLWPPSLREVWQGGVAELLKSSYRGEAGRRLSYITVFVGQK